MDRGFCLSIGGLWEIHAALAERLVLRARRLAFQLAVNALRSVDERVLLTLWHVGDRWGRVTPDGIRLRLPLTHKDIADVVGASRPSTTTALIKLRRDGHIEPRPGGWLLRGSPPAQLHELKTRAAA
ncbi:MAG TPA: Crp/Fnr family transcriptional regulator [Solirubrobacteraceae bacterium]|nr:Crp/Fnr family transcriptional regulator [Solirubrobacteraceae bacterium]